ncbi:uncharacterized protein LOC110088871 isoform X2 [Pogona vitticeps]
MGMGVHPRPLDWPVGTANITLDPDTAHLQLIVSEDHKSVTCGSEFQDLPDNRKPRVLCRGQTLYCQHMRSTTLPTFSGNPVPSVPGRRMCVRGSYWHRLRPCGRKLQTECGPPEKAATYFSSGQDEVRMKAVEISGALLQSIPVTKIEEMTLHLLLTGLEVLRERAGRHHGGSGSHDLPTVMAVIPAVGECRAPALLASFSSLL